MHSFHQSRGRILFEVLCALGIVASCVGAWQQTDASALLAAASVAGLHGFVHLFDLARGDPVEARAPQRIEFEEESVAAVPAKAPPVITAVEAIDDMAAPPAKAPRKGGRKAKAPKTAALLEEPASPMFAEEASHHRPAPLFEPEPFVRTVRAGFGRRSRLAAR
ncbi:MAG: hypothetical protein ACJ8FC_07570 [Sphingomicrobium sp.]